MATLLQQAVITCVRPLILREVPGWGKIYDTFVGSFENNVFWNDAGVKIIKDKRHGYLLELDISGWSERYAFFLGRWYDLPSQLLIDAALKPGDEVVDIGGNIGMFTLAARAKIGDAGRVYAFEPNPAPRRKFERHLAINGIDNVKITPVALHNREGRATFNFPKINTGEGSLSKLNYPDEATESIEVEIKVGDDALRGANPRLVKIDVEGAEIGVLSGLKEITARAHPVIIAEYVPHHLKRFEASFTNFEAFAQKHGYRIFRQGLRRQGGAQRLTLKPITASAPGGGDIVFIHERDQSLDQWIV